MWFMIQVLIFICTAGWRYYTSENWASCTFTWSSLINLVQSNIYSRPSQSNYFKFGIFWVNIVISKLNLLYRYCLKLIGELRKEKEFRQQCCRNSTKIRSEKDREKEEEFRQHCYRNSSAQIPARAKKKNNCGNAIAEIGKKKNLVIVAMELPKMKKKKKNWMELWQCHCRKWEEKKILLPKSGKNFLKKCYVHKFFYNTFTKNHRWLVIISSNLILTLRLLF